ncbi:integrase [Paraburkholderia youngii]
MSLSAHLRTGCAILLRRIWQTLGVDLRTGNENLGHASLTTTSLYLHSEDDERHRETVNLHTMKWEGVRAAAVPDDPAAQ